MTMLIANLIFWGAVATFVVVVYQAAVLPGIRQGLRFDVFRLRDELRRLVVEGHLSDQDERFALLQDKLNFMAVNMSRFDLAGAVEAVRFVRSSDETTKQRIQTYLNLMNDAEPTIKRVYEDSVKVFVKAVVLNSLLSFVIATLIMLGITAVKVPIAKLKDALWLRAKEDSQFAFFNAPTATL